MIEDDDSGTKLRRMREEFVKREMRIDTVNWSLTTSGFPLAPIYPMLILLNIRRRA